MSRTYTTAADDAKSVRDALKTYRWNSRHVSIRARNFAGGSAVDAVVKSPEVDPRIVERELRRVTSIRRCEFSGEILSVGNRYTHVRRSEACDEALARRYGDAIAAAYKQALAAGPGAGFAPGGMPAGVRVYIYMEHATLAYASVHHDRDDVRPARIHLGITRDGVPCDHSCAAIAVAVEFPEMYESIQDEA